MGEPTKRAWFQPELVVIVRGNPEELVLEGCKTASISGPGTGSGGCGEAPCAGAPSS